MVRCVFLTRMVRRLCTGIFLLTSLYILLAYQFGISIAAPEGTNNQEVHRKRPRLLNKFTRSTSRFARIKDDPFSNDFIADDDDLFELSKRQTTADDYGHLRFGKRGEDVFDDYGHWRFGRTNEVDIK